MRHLRTQTSDLDRKPGRVDHALEQIRALGERTVVKHGAEQKAAAAHRSQIAPRVGRHPGRTSGGVHVLITLGQPEEEFEARVTERLGEHVAGRFRRGTAGAQLNEVALDPS